MKYYLHGLNSLRAIAALVVLVGHIELVKSQRGLPSAFDAQERWLPEGHLGVVLFFVLSGYLITFLLTKEREKNGHVSLRKFYMRRILRVWPLYYFILLVSFALFRMHYGTGTVLLSVFGMPNIANALQIKWPSSPQIWSIGVEEQFYLVWPWLFMLIPTKRLIGFLIFFFLGYSMLPYVVDFINSRTISNVSLYGFTGMFFYGTKFNSMALGCLLGFMVARKHWFLRFIANPLAAKISVLVTFGLWFSAVEFTRFNDEVYSILFGLTILNIGGLRSWRLDPEVQPFVFLGKISYGIYMYHWIVLMLVLDWMPIGLKGAGWGYNIGLYSAVILGTILVSWLSHISMERFFIRRKLTYEVT